MPLNVGDAAPDFNVLDDQGNTRTLADFAGKRTVFYFYPKDNTPGCTTEAQNFRDLLTEFEAEDTTIIGISPDSPKTHQNFKAKHELPFTLLSDKEKTMLTAYAAWGEKKNYGRTYMGVIRSTIVVGPESKIEAVYSNIRVKGHVEKVLTAIRADKA